jgi:hypothetical protein
MTAWLLVKLDEKKKTAPMNKHLKKSILVISTKEKSHKFQTR